MSLLYVLILHHEMWSPSLWNALHTELIWKLCSTYSHVLSISNCKQVPLKVWPCLQSYVLLICIIVKYCLVKFEWVLYPVKLTLLQKMADFKKQCMCIQLCFILGRSATETLEILELAFREEIARRTQVSDWFSI